MDLQANLTKMAAAPDRGAVAEQATSHRNTALAEFMAASGNLKNPATLTIGTCVHHCAVGMSCRQLVLAGRFLTGMAGAPRLVSPRGCGGSTF